MADEITLQFAARLRKSESGNELLGRPYTAAFQADMSGKKGPSPGALSVSQAGVAVSLSQLTTPGFCWIEHQGLLSGTAADTDYLMIGIRDPGLNVFYPVLELKPGWRWPLFLSRNLLEEFTVATGTGTGAANNELYLKSGSANTLVVSVEAYEA